MSRLPTRQDLRDMLALALPIAGVQVGLMLMGVVDTIMVGHVSPTALAAVALGTLYFFAVVVFAFGTLLALDPLVSQGVGAGDHVQVERSIQRALVLAVALTLIASALCLPVRPLLVLMRQPADVIPLAVSFVHVSIPGILPFLAFVVLRQSLQAMRRMRAIVVTIVIANVVNATLCWVLVFGNLGAPALGAVGSSLASTISRWLMLACLFLLARKELRPILSRWHREAFDLAALRRLAALGVPIGFQTSLEFGVFAVVALLMGSLGTAPMAGHQIAINLASLTFMVPLGVSSAASVLVGQAIGRGDQERVQRTTLAGLVIGVGFMTLSASAFILFPGLLARLYSPDAAVLAVAVTLIPIAGVFQVFDGTQVVASGILRGSGDTRAPMIVNVLGFWLLGFPISLGLCYGAGLGPVGLWWGLVVGLMAVAAFLLLRVRSRMRRSIQRLQIDVPEGAAASS